MRRAVLALALLAGLAACSNRPGPYPALLEAARGALGDGGQPGAAQAVPDRAALTAIPSTVIAVSFGADRPVYLTPIADAGGYRSFQDRARRGVVLFGAAVAGTDGLGQDLLAVRHDPADPVARPRPLRDWPGQLDRSYQYRVRDGAAFAITVTCVIDVAARERIEILGEGFDTVRVVESCASPRRRFQNLYWVAPETGRIWRSLQWLGPRLTPVAIELINP